MLLDVMVAEAEVVGELGKGAAAAVGIGEVAQTGAIGISGHENLRGGIWL